MAVRYWYVGGYVRDQYLGRKPKDVDMAIEGLTSFEALKVHLEEQKAVIYTKDPEHLTVRCKHPKWGLLDMVMCRRDLEYKDDGRHPVAVEHASILEDLARRDFTIN